jgi:Zn-dependent protease with chaperone function
MNFFEQQDQARKSTRLLVGLFGLSVGAMTGCIYLATIMAMGLTPLSGSNCRQSALPKPIAILASRKSSSGSLSRSRSSRSTSGFGSSSSHSDFGSSSSHLDPFGRRYSGYSSYDRRSGRYSSSTSCNTSSMVARGWFHPQILFWVTLITSSVVGMASLYKINELKGGGAVIAQELGGELLLPETADALGQQLLNVVEEMAIAAGIPIPSVYLLNHEREINAFAAGFDPKDAVIGVTRGSLEQLTRDELQGVIGHEFSHILNGDMRLNIQLMGLLHGILFIYIFGRLFLYVPIDSDEDRPSISFYALGLSLMAIGSLGVLWGRLIQSAVSRQREFLADASAVQFTRNPNGIAGALEKLAGIGSRVRSPHAQATSHMFFGNAMGFGWTGNLLATHPPLFTRIEKIRGVKVSNEGASQLITSTTIRSGMMGFAGNSNAVSPNQVVQQVGTVTPAHYAHAQGLLAQLPDSLRGALREPIGAIATIYALFLETEDPTLRDQQMHHLGHLPEAQLAEILTHDSEIRFLDPRLRLPLVDLAIPALRQCSSERLHSLLEDIEVLVNADGKWTLSEFALFLVLQRRLDSSLFPHRETPIQFQTLDPVWPDALAVLSALANAGDVKPEAVAYAFRCGAFKLPGATPQTVPEAPAPWTFTTLPEHLERLRQTAPKLKQLVINACAHTVLLDNEVTVQEAELLRAFTITLDCPIPPFLNSARASKSSAS